MARRAFYSQLDEAFEPGSLSHMKELPWPKQGQKLFRPATTKTPTNARAIVHWLNNGFPTGLKDTTFKEAGELLTEAVLEGGDGTDPDRFAFPIIYLYRHATELILKDIVRQSQHLGLIGRTEAKKALVGHALYPLWNLAKVAIADLPGSQEDVQAAEGLISELHQADPDGQSLRYETNRSGTPNVVRLPGTIDLMHLRKMFQGLWGFLEASAGMLTDMGRV